jgi:putative toxin-antitoxin system antitoxin component (TIGR02293 family)
MHTHEKEIVQAAIHLFAGDKPAAHNWLYNPVKSLDWQKPIELMQTVVGREAILAAIRRMESGLVN